MRQKKKWTSQHFSKHIPWNIKGTFTPAARTQDRKYIKAANVIQMWNSGYAICLGSLIDKTR
jgi:hypothetical protein